MEWSSSSITDFCNFRRKFLKSIIVYQLIAATQFIVIVKEAGLAFAMVLGFRMKEWNIFCCLEGCGKFLKILDESFRTPGGNLRVLLCSSSTWKQYFNING